MLDTSPITTMPSVASMTRDERSFSKIADDFDDFLKIMVTQMQNQDPTAPLDSNEFTAQIVAFSQVEQALNTNKKLDDLIGLSKGTKNSDIVSFVGKEVEVEGNYVMLEAGSDVDFSYNVDTAVDKVYMAVEDAAGVVVYTAETTGLAGKNTLTWDGKSNSGNLLDPGKYKIVISTLTGEGLEEITPTVKGIVQGVNLEDVNPTLIVNGDEIPLENVKFIGQPS